MLLKKASDLKDSDITSRKLFLERRKFLAQSTALAACALTAPLSSLLSSSTPPRAPQKLSVAKRGEFTAEEKTTPYEDATGYVNFYEFSTSKREPRELARNFRTRPWTVVVEGAVKRPLRFDIEELARLFPLEERVYRWRCVEAWSMVIPWIGFPLADFIKKCEPTNEGKFVEFTTLYDPEQMPGQRTASLKWPYVEGLRLDEARHPLALLAVGMYGESLPPQNGAPLRLVVPWKYGFKSIKSIVKVRFLAKMPKTTWNSQRPEEYGFYANINPFVSHPRWSQARERRIGEDGRRETIIFNGYGDQVERLYAGMNLKRFY